MLAYIEQLAIVSAAEPFYAFVTFIIMLSVLCGLIFIINNTKNKLSDTINTMSYGQKVLMMLVIFFSFGILLAVVGNYTSKLHPILSTIFTSIGTLFMFGTSYSCYTDFVSNRGVISEIKNMITDAVDLKENHRTIEDMGIQKIIRFDTDELLKKMASSKSCKMLCLYNLNFIKIHYSKILELVQNGLKIEVIMSDPSDDALFDCLQNSFDRTPAETIKDNTTKAFKFWCEDVCAHCNNKVTIKTINWPSTYSAYIFDENEMWFLPRHTSKGKKDPYVFIINKTDHVSSNFFFQDIIDTSKASTQHNNCSTCQTNTPFTDQTIPSTTGATTPSV
ncbi:hypothetical protein [Nitratidesulfovibrio liaohensis]|uniref:hypothetical protein n=1 Tax=Nitratidesulfovibrio liaohensis TaxID=2604158 RepID=UPI00141DAFF1|nr:hypothetical protein [Nitratidesulfovibrio liaohensis]NHZ48173.1 hypothetical protein [Nitratidesulfovibrio liaohensis]